MFGRPCRSVDERLLEAEKRVQDTLVRIEKQREIVETSGPSGRYASLVLQRLTRALRQHEAARDKLRSRALKAG
jgi:hypothetical protein